LHIAVRAVEVEDAVGGGRLRVERGGMGEEKEREKSESRNLRSERSQKSET
jgi:hypothetical protein